MGRVGASAPRPDTWQESDRQVSHVPEEETKWAEREKWDRTGEEAGLNQRGGGTNSFHEGGDKTDAVPKLTEIYGK